MSEKVRYDNIDVARGLAMLVIIQWHVVACIQHGQMVG